MSIQIHPDAAKRFDALANKLLAKIAPPDPDLARVGEAFRPDIHPVSHISEQGIIGKIRQVESIINGAGEEIGRLFQHENRQLGLIGENFKALVQLATRLHDVEELKDTTSMEFVKESALEWLEARYKNTLQELLTDYVLRKAEAEIKDYEIWFPLHRTYLESSFPMGPVVFRTVTREMMDECEAKAPEQDRETAMAVQLVFARDRSAIQGCGAAAVKIRAEKNKALEIGREQADTAAALLRFLAPANWTPKLRSFCTLLGSENLRRGTELFLEGSSISGLSRNLLDRGDHQWVLSNAYLAHFPGILSRLHALSASPSRMPFQQALYEALLIHSRNSVAVEPADKLVYILVALESVLLRNTNEPLGKNIGERMAFLVGRSLEDRKAVVPVWMRFTS